MEGGQDKPQRKEEDQVSDEALGEAQNPFEELEGLTSEVQGEEEDKFIDMTGRRRRQRKRDEFIDIAGRNADRDEEERRAA